ncbi:MAG: DUF1294 domain-containing protein [Oscillospiraceae bacterium]|nr:DUF1294 domain-containing protein [Oscillospiraceae bacterium]
MAQSVPFLLIAVFVLMSIILFLVMGRDKALSKTRKRRVPEATLFLLALLGGALGGVLGMQIFRHKTQHMSFVVGFPLLALLQWGAVIWMLLPD